MSPPGSFWLWQFPDFVSYDRGSFRDSGPGSCRTSLHGDLSTVFVMLILRLCVLRRKNMFRSNILSSLYWRYAKSAWFIMGLTRLSLITWVRLYLLGFTQCRKLLFSPFPSCGLWKDVSMHSFFKEGCDAVPVWGQRSMPVTWNFAWEICLFSPHLFIYSISHFIYIFYGLMGFYLYWSITQLDFILLLKSS